jgi:hypothetical protein
MYTWRKAKHIHERQIGEVYSSETVIICQTTQKIITNFILKFVLVTVTFHVWLCLLSCLAWSSTLELEAICPSETSGCLRTLRRYNPEYYPLHRQRLRTQMQPAHHSFLTLTSSHAIQVVLLNLNKKALSPVMATKFEWVAVMPRTICHVIWIKFPILKSKNDLDHDSVVIFKQFATVTNFLCWRKYHLTTLYQLLAN